MIIPPTGNEFIAMMKDTALVSFIGVSAEQAEIFRRAQLAGTPSLQARSRPICSPPGCTGSSTIIFTFFQSRLERRIGKGYVRGDQKRTKIVSMSGQGGKGGAMSVGDRRAVGWTRTSGTGALR